MNICKRNFRLAAPTTTTISCHVLSSANVVKIFCKTHTDDLHVFLFTFVRIDFIRLHVYHLIIYLFKAVVTASSCKFDMSPTSERQPKRVLSSLHHQVFVYFQNWK